MDLIQRPVRFLPRIERVNNSISSSIYFLLDIHNNIYLYFKKLRTENAILFIHERKDSNFLFQNIEKLRTENAILLIRDERKDSNFPFQNIEKLRTENAIAILLIHERRDSNFLFQNIEKLRTENAILFIRDEGFEFSISKYRSRKCICISIRVLKNTQLSSASIRE